VLTVLKLCFERYLLTYLHNTDLAMHSVSCQIGSELGGHSVSSSVSNYDYMLVIHSSNVGLSVRTIPTSGQK
jgi:hypothetical protein